MAKLGQLRDAEEKAQLEIEKAEREAQRVRLSIPDLQEAESREFDERLRKIVHDEENKVEDKISLLSEELEKESESRLNKLAVYRKELEKAATDSLKEYILNSGNSNR